MSLGETNGLSPFGHPKGKMQADGSWQRNSNGARVALKLPIGFATADAATLYTVPAGTRLLIEKCFYEITTPFSGGASSAIGLSSDQTAYSSKGDLFGSASGDTNAGQLGAAGLKSGTAGTDVAAGPVILEAGSKIRFDRITSAFTAGAGFVHVLAQVVG